MYVLAIGVDKYRMKDYELRYAAEDADSFAKAIETVGSGLFAKVIPTVLKNDQVTATAIGKAFDQIGAGAKPSDVFVLFLGGHGKSVEGRYYYYPQNSRFCWRDRPTRTASARISGRMAGEDPGTEDPIDPGHL